MRALQRCRPNWWPSPARPGFSPPSNTVSPRCAPATSCGFLADEALARRARELSGHLLRIPAEGLKRDFAAVTAASSEATTAPTAQDGAAATPGREGMLPSSRGGALQQFTIDLTAAARAGKIDPILGRESEIRQVVDILTRRRQNNPILTGEAGVGKTAVVEGFACRIAAGDVPPALRGVVLRTLDLGLLQAGAGIKGEFEIGSNQ